MPENNTMALMKFFSVTTSEFREFWQSLSDEEKEYYKSADLG